MRMRRKKSRGLNSGTGPARRPTTLTLPRSPSRSMTWGAACRDVVDGRSTRGERWRSWPIAAIGIPGSKVIAAPSSSKRRLLSGLRDRPITLCPMARASCTVANPRPRRAGDQHQRIRRQAPQWSAPVRSQADHNPPAFGVTPARGISMRLSTELPLVRKRARRFTPTSLREPPAVASPSPVTPGSICSTVPTPSRRAHGRLAWPDTVARPGSDRRGQTRVANPQDHLPCCGMGSAFPPDASCQYHQVVECQARIAQ